jgi:hypothetical protein
MASSKYLAGLFAIMALIWVTMIMCLLIVFYMLPSMEQLASGGIDRLITAIIQLVVSGSIIIFWLYSWNMLVKAYFWRNLNKTEVKAAKAVDKKHK